MESILNILHVAPNFNWCTIFILPIAKKQYAVGNCVWISTPENHSEINCNESDVKFVSWHNKYNKFISHIFYSLCLINEIKKNKIQKVYLHTTIDSFFYIFVLRVFTSVDVIYVNHGVPFVGYKGIIRALFKFIEFSNLNLSHRVIAINQSMGNLLAPLNFLKIDMFILKPGTLVGVNIKYKNYKELLQLRNKYKFNNKIRIVYVGRPELRKGIYDLLKGLSETKLNYELIILGGVESDIKIDVDSSKVKFLGYKKDLESYYLSSDILCVPSHHEGFGQIYLEAASFGVIPVCCDIPGPTDFIKHDFNGLVVKPKSTEELKKLFDNISDGLFDLEKLKYNSYVSSFAYSSEIVVESNMEFFI